MGIRTFGAIALLTLLTLAGCASSPPSQFYLMNPASPEHGSSQYTADLEGKLVSISPVGVPAYVNRPQLVERVGVEELRLMEFHQWAEPLDDALLLSLQDNLTEMLGAKGFSFLAWDQAKKSDYRLRLEVTRLDGALNGKLVLAAWWSVASGQERDILSLNRCRLTKEVKGGSPKDLVAAHVEAVTDLSRRIADSLEKLR